MSLTQPPPPDPSDDIDRPPSRRFRALFALAMLLIAIGYMWVWRVKTERVTTETAPVLVFAGAETQLTDGIDAASVEARTIASLNRIRGITVIDADSARASGQGADQLLSVELSTGERGLRLTMRRIDVAGDSLLHVYRVDGATLDEVAHRMAVQLAMSFGLPRPDAALPGGNPAPPR